PAQGQHEQREQHADMVGMNQSTPSFAQVYLMDEAGHQRESDYPPPHLQEGAPDPLCARSLLRRCDVVVVGGWQRHDLPPAEVGTRIALFSRVRGVYSARWSIEAEPTLGGHHRNKPAVNKRAVGAPAKGRRSQNSGLSVAAAGWRMRTIV